MRQVLRAGVLFTTLVSAAAFSTTCPFDRYFASGRVLVPAEVNAAAVRVFIFLEGADSTSAYPPERGEHDYATPADDGTFRFISYYSTRNPKAKLPWQGCNRRALHADVIAIGEGLTAKRIRVSIRKAQQAESGLMEFVVEIPPITMERLKYAPTE